MLDATSDTTFDTCTTTFGITDDPGATSIGINDDTGDTSTTRPATSAATSTTRDTSTGANDSTTDETSATNSATADDSIDDDSTTTSSTTSDTDTSSTTSDTDTSSTTTDTDADTDTSSPTSPTGATATFSTLSVKALEDELSSLAARLAASTCRFLLAVAEYDRRQAYESWECHDMAAWLSWKCGISPVTAREQVRVARCLETLHVVRARFSTGTLSYSQVRAITRVATPETEEALVDLATISTAAQLEALTRAYRRTREASKAAESHRYRRRYLQMHYDDEGFLVGSFRLPPETGAVLSEAVRQLVDHERLEAICASEVDEDIDPYGAGCADALVELVSTGAAHGVGPDQQSDDRRYLVTVLVDADTLAEDTAGQGDGEQGGAGQGDGKLGRLTHGAGGQDTAEQDTGQGAGWPSSLRQPADSQPRARWHLAGTEHASASEQASSFAGPAQACADPTRLVRTGAGHGLEATESEAPREPGVCQIVGGPGLWGETARRVACDAAIVTVTEDQSGNLLDLGRRTRRPSRALRRALRLRDGHCQFPSCTRTRTEAHHIVHWVNGGPTALANLVSLCSHHHHRLHEGGYRVLRTHEGQLRFVDRDGRVLPEIATLGPADDRPEPEVEPYHCDWEGSRMPYGDVIEGLLQIEGLLHGQWSLRGEGALGGEGPVHGEGSLDGEGLLDGEDPVRDQWPLDGEGSAHGDELGRDSAESSPGVLDPALAALHRHQPVIAPT